MNRRLPAITLAAISSVAAGCFGMFHSGTSNQGITSDTHKKHVGGMVFSSAVIKHGAENPSSFIDHCTLGQPCYARFYFAESLTDAAHDPTIRWIALRATVDGTAMQPDGVFQMQGNWSTYNFTLFRAPGDQVPWEHPAWFLDKVAGRLQPGDHTLQIDVLAAQAGEPAGVGHSLATGKIAYTVPPNAAEIISAAMPGEEQLLAAQQSVTEGAPTEEASCLPNGTRRDGLVSSADCCSDKVHDIYNDPSNQYSGTKAEVCCGAKDDAPTNECH